MPPFEEGRTTIVRPSSYNINRVSLLPSSLGQIALGLVVGDGGSAIGVIDPFALIPAAHIHLIGEFLFILHIIQHPHFQLGSCGFMESRLHLAPEHNTELGHIFFRPKAKRRTGAVDLIVDGGKQIFLNGAPSEFLVGADLHIQLDPLTLLAGPDFLQPDCLGGQLIVI